MHDKHRKIQYATVVIVFIALSIFSVFASMAFHKMLIGTDRVPQLYPIKECIKSIVTVEKHRLLFLCLVGLSFCASVTILVSYSTNYMSKLQRITPDIYTPVAVGQNQHGSAKWMKEKAKAKTFKTMVLDPNDSIYKMLINAGKIDRAAIKLHVIDAEEEEKKQRHIGIFEKAKPVIEILMNKVYSKENQYKLHKIFEQIKDNFMKKYLPGVWKIKRELQIEDLIDGFDDELFVDEVLDEPTTSLADEGEYELVSKTENDLTDVQTTQGENGWERGTANGLKIDSPNYSINGAENDSEKDWTIHFSDDIEDDLANGTVNKTRTKIVDAADKEPLHKEVSKEKSKFEQLSRSPPIQKGGIVVGMKKMHGGKELHYFIDDDTHVLCIGATRSGKSRTLVIQSICNLGLAGESLIISDPKGELFQYTSAYLKRLGYNVIVLDFKNPLRSQRYNLLQPIIDAVDDDNIPQATECVWDLVSILVGEAKGEKIWTNGEASTIACAIMSVVFDNKEGGKRKYQTLTNVYFFIAEMCKPVGKKMPIVEYVKELPENHPAKPLVAISEIAPERTRGSFYTAALTTLKLFTSSYINAMTNSSDYNPKDLGREKTALFFVLPDERTTYYSIASILVLQHYIQLVNESDSRGGRLKKRVNFLLDEFGNFASIPNFDTLLTVGGGRGMRFNLFLQDFAQLESKYDENVAKTIKGNCQVWDYLQTDNEETL
ncbi:MAG TPA: type IV secretory system conjugative DNA transfer family protein, partial [Ruminiclostridium sp.]